MQDAELASSLLRTDGEFCGAPEQQDNEGDKVQSGEPSGQALVVAGEAVEAGHPTDRTFHHPASRQQNEAALGFRQADDIQGNAVRSSGFGSPFSGVALIHKGEFDGSAGCILHGLARAATAERSSAFAGVTCSAGRWPGVSTVRCSLEPLVRSCPSQAAQLPLSGVERSVRLSSPAAEGSSVGLCARRSTGRRSCTSASKQPPRSHCCTWSYPACHASRRWHGAPGHAVAHQVAQTVEHRAQAVLALRRRLGQQRQVGRDQTLSIIGNIGRIRLALRHPPKLMPTPSP